MIDLVDELLEAHLDTVELALEPRSDFEWSSHVEYLRALHRCGQELLARLA